ncbi:MAG: hypothetical protein ABIF08_01160 [Nanoarchaeota archaeon]
MKFKAPQGKPFPDRDLLIEGYMKDFYINWQIYTDENLIKDINKRGSELDYDRQPQQYYEIRRVSGSDVGEEDISFLKKYGLEVAEKDEHIDSDDIKG